MARVAILAHVKESTIPEPPSVTRVGPRIPWTGGKIVSNKDEALRKFYERKLQKGASSLTPAQRQALEESLAKLGAPVPSSNSSKKDHPHKSKHDVIHKIDPSTKRMVHRANVKVSANNKKTLVVNGRVVGPRVKASVARGPIVTAKKKQSKPSDSGLALQDKLGMSLDALVKRSSK